MFRAEVKRLQMPAPAEIPQMQVVAVFALHQQVEVGAALDHVRRAPFAGDRDVVAEMPPEIVAEELGTAVDLPAAEHVKAFMVEQETSAGSATLGVAERAHVDGIGSAVNRMWPAVSRARRDLLRFDHLDQLRTARIGLGIDDVQAR